MVLKRFAFAFKKLSPAKFLSKVLPLSAPLPQIQFHEESSCMNFASAALEPPLTFSQTLEQHQLFKFAQNKTAQKLFSLRRPVRVAKLPPRFRNHVDWENAEFRPKVSSSFGLSLYFNLNRFFLNSHLVLHVFFFIKNKQIIVLSRN